MGANWHLIVSNRAVVMSLWPTDQRSRRLIVLKVPSARTTIGTAQFRERSHVSGLMPPACSFESAAISRIYMLEVESPSHTLINTLE